MQVAITTWSKFPIRGRGKRKLKEKGTLKNLITNNCLREVKLLFVKPLLSDGFAEISSADTSSWSRNVPSEMFMSDVT